MAVVLLNLSAGDARLSLTPALGAGIARLDHGGKPVLRPWTGNLEEGPFALASNILVPFSNRISKGGFSFQGENFQIAPNFAGEKFPIHGDGFQRPWIVTSQSEKSATLSLNNGNIGPFRYRAEQVFCLTAQGLRVELSVTNSGGVTLPFGCGFHPWFPRNEHTRLGFSTTGVWLEDANHLPTTHLKLDDGPDWDFTEGRVLPDRWFNNVWTDWSGTARIEQSEQFTSVNVTASDNLNCAVLFTIDKDCDFVCFEPVSHAVDAHNRSGMPGLTILDPGQAMSAWMELSWDDD